MKKERTLIEKLFAFIFLPLLVINTLGVLFYLGMILVSAFLQLDYSSPLMNSMDRASNYIESIIYPLFPLLLLSSGLLIVLSVIYKRNMNTHEGVNQAIKKPILKAIGVLVLTILFGLVLTVSQSYVYDGCGPGGAYCIEYHAALAIYDRPDVKEVIDKYPSHIAWVSPLNYTYIEDKDFVKRLLPDYADVDIHCILIAHSPEGTRYFLEEGDTAEVFIEIPSDEFDEVLKNASQEDVQTFWKNIRPDVRLVEEYFRDSEHRSHD